MHLCNGKNARHNRKVLRMIIKLFFRQLLVVLLSCLSCIAGTKEGKKMEAECWPVKPVEIGFNEGVRSIFPVPMNYSFGMIAGKEDQETLRLAMIKGQHLNENTFPRKPLEPYKEFGYCVGDCKEMYLSGNRILYLLDWKLKKIIIDYWGVGDALENQYAQTKLIDDKNKIVLSIFSPFYDDKFDNIINNTYSLTLEDLINKKRIKSLPISTESGRFLTDKRSMFRSSPNFAFGPDYVVYRESAKYNWLCVNYSLEYIVCPLKDTLNSYKEYFDIAVDSILTNRCFSYLHILIPADSNRMPTMHDSVTCEHIYDLFKGKCSKNGVILLEDSINYHRNSGRIIDTLQVFTYEGQEMPDKDSILEFEWDDHPQNIYYQFLGDNFDAVYFKYIDANNKKYFFQSTIKDRKIKWVQRSKSEYFRAATLSYLAIPLDIALLPFELIFLIYCLIEFHNHPIQL